MRALSVVGGRSNLVQLAPVARALGQAPDVEHLRVHVGRHDSPEVAAAIAELELPPVQFHLEVGEGSDGVQIGLMLQRLEPALAELQPDVVLAYGDDRAAAAAALAASTLRVRFGHVEAGLRCGAGAGGGTMPRGLPPAAARLRFPPPPPAPAPLEAQGLAPGGVH